MFPNINVYLCASVLLLESWLGQWRSRQEQNICIFTKRLSCFSEAAQKKTRRLLRTISLCSLPKKLTISAPCGDEIGSIGNFRDAEFYGFVSKDNFCWDAPSWRKNILNRTSLCSATWGDITICNREASLSFSLAWHNNTPGCLTNKQQLVNLWFVSLCICCSHLVMSSPSLSQKTFRITTRVEDASVGGQEQGGHCYISPHFKFTRWSLFFIFGFLWSSSVSAPK